MVFAQLNEDGVCIAVTSTDTPMIGEQFVELESLDASVLRKQWTGTQWVDVPT